MCRTVSCGFHPLIATRTTQSDTWTERGRRTDSQNFFSSFDLDQRIWNCFLCTVVVVSVFCECWQFFVWGKKSVFYSLTFQPSVWQRGRAPESLISDVCSSKTNSLFIGPDCVCAHTPLMKLHPRLHHRLLFLLRLLLMSSHFLWASDKPTKQGENRALYWDACQDSPWIYGQQTAFITHPRGKVKRAAGVGRERGKQWSSPPFSYWSWRILFLENVH